jgi:hypothetical protein
LADHAGLIGGRIWHDEHLFRDGAMSGRDIEVLVASWQDIGLEPFSEVDGKKKPGKIFVLWKVCLVVPRCPAIGLRSAKTGTQLS